METFAPPRDLIADSGFGRARAEALARFDRSSIDAPIADLVAGFAVLPHCFTLQSCYGHFVCGPGDAPENLDPIPDGHTGAVRYRIAYLALCIEHSARGQALLDALSRVPAIDPGYVQFGSPAWFRDRWANTYALQVEPAALQDRDEALLDADEARHMQDVRRAFFARIADLLAAEIRAGGLSPPRAPTS